MADRGRYVAAALTVCRAFMLVGRAAGQAAAVVRRLVEHRAVGAAVARLRRPGAHHGGRVRGRPGAAGIGAVLEAWAKVFEEDSVTVAEIIKRAGERDSAGGL